VMRSGKVYYTNR